MKKAYSSTGLRLYHAPFVFHLCDKESQLLCIFGKLNFQNLIVSPFAKPGDVTAEPGKLHITS